MDVSARANAKRGLRESNQSEFSIRNPWTRERDYGFEAILCSRVGWITDWQYGLRIDKIAFGREVWFLIFFNWKFFQSPIRNP